MKEEARRRRGGSNAVKPKTKRKEISHRDAVKKIRAAQTFVVDLPGSRRVRIPTPSNIAFYVGLALIVSLRPVRCLPRLDRPVRAPPVISITSPPEKPRAAHGIRTRHLTVGPHCYVA